MRTAGAWIRMGGPLLAVLASCLPASGVVVALKDYATVATGGQLSAVFTGAITGSTISVYTDATKDTQLSQYTAPTSAAFWYNFGTATKSVYIGTTSGTPLIQFNLSLLPGFAPGAQINKAELRLKEVGGNSGGFGSLRYVATQDWSEGNKNSTYPGAAPAAPGATRAHPNGVNTSTNQKADGSPGTSSSGSWGVNGDAQWDEAVDSAAVPDLVTKRDSGNNAWIVCDVTTLVNSWAQGTIANRGFALPGTTSNNRVIAFSEYATTNANYEPVLFIDYTPVPEPVTLALAATVVSVALMRRRR